MAEPAKHRVRFSIRSLLLWTVVISAVLAAWTTWWRSTSRLRDARREITNLSKQLGLGGGYMPAEDVSIKVRPIADSALCWSWQIGVPSGRRYTIYRVQDGIPATGLPAGGGLSWGSTDPGLQTFTVGFGRIRKASGSPWGLFRRLERDGGGSGGTGHTTDPVGRRQKLAWLLDSQTDWTIEQFGGEGAFETFDKDPIVLLRIRAKTRPDSRSETFAEHDVLESSAARFAPAIVRLLYFRT